MSRLPRLSATHESWSRPLSRLPGLISLGSGLYISVVISWVLTTRPPAGLGVETLFDIVLVLIPGVSFLYIGLRLPALEIDPATYPTLVGWVLAGMGAMVAFLFLRVAHPGVDADWTVGTQAISFTIGSVGGLLIGLQQARAISRAHQLEARNTELAARKQELAHQNRRLDRFTGVVSHDLRSPLAATAGWVEMAATDCDSEYLPEAAAGLSRMGTIIDNTLELAKQGQTVAAFEPVDFATLVGDCWQMTATDDTGRPPDDGLTVDGEATICGDPDRLRQLFENLFRNCVEHVGPTVSVTTGLFGEDGFYVEDDGPGIPTAYREVLFEPGYTTTDDGSGFGLAIVAEIVDAHGWTICATDSDSGGARFEITSVTIPGDDEKDYYCA